MTDGYVTADYLRRAAEQLRALKELSYARLHLAPGQRVLDAGCGPGVDTVPLARQVGAAGRVYALDFDAAMLDQARQAAAAAGVAHIEHLLASARAIPLADAAVDGCRAERLLQVLPEAAGAEVVAELVRVTRPGGRLVIVDAEWGSASVDFSDNALERRLMDHFARRMRPNGFAGRQAARWLRAQPVAEVAVELLPHQPPRLDDTPFGDWLTGSAVGAGCITPAQAAAWQEELRGRERDGSFFASVNMVVVAATRA